MSIPRTRSKNVERFGDSVRAPGTHAAVTLLVADISAIAAYGQGLAWFVLVAIGAAAVAYLVARLHQPLVALLQSFRPSQIADSMPGTYGPSRDAAVSPRAKAGY